MHATYLFFLKRKKCSLAGRMLFFASKANVFRDLMFLRNVKLWILMNVMQKTKVSLMVALAVNF